MPGCRQSKLSEVAALISGHREKAAQLAQQCSAPSSGVYSYENFDSIAQNDRIDAVYINLPNSMHAEYTVRAAKEGKHVLCETPMSTSVKDTEAMIAACRKARRKLMIAYRCQYEPVNLRAISRDWRGGPLMDVGIYSLNACRFLTGEEPTGLEGHCTVIDKDAFSLGHRGEL